jgi:hypothetical protein
MNHTTSPTQLAIQYAIDNPHATPDEIQAMFAIRQCDAAYAHLRGVNASRTDWPIRPDGKGRRPLNNAAALAAAREWSLKNTNNEKAIYDRFNITSAQSRKIRKEATAAKGGRKCNEENRAKALAFLKENIHTPSRQIGKMFSVSPEWICQQRRRILSGERSLPTTPLINRSRPEPPKPRRKVNELHAVMCDGSMVDPKRVKDWKCVVRFEKVVV